MAVGGCEIEVNVKSNEACLIHRGVFVHYPILRKSFSERQEHVNRADVMLRNFRERACGHLAYCQPAERRLPRARWREMSIDFVSGI